MAVGLIIATAFNKIVSSMVNDILMPLVTYFTGASSMADLSIPLRIVDGEVTLSFAYGAFLQTVIDFLIIALSVFIMVKFMMNSQKKFRELKVIMKEESTEEARKKRKELRAKARAEGHSVVHPGDTADTEQQVDDLVRAIAYADALGIHTAMFGKGLHKAGIARLRITEGLTSLVGNNLAHEGRHALWVLVAGHLDNAGKTVAAGYLRNAEAGLIGFEGRHFGAHIGTGRESGRHGAILIFKEEKGLPLRITQRGSPVELNQYISPDRQGHKCSCR